MLLSIAYFPPIEYFALLAKYSVNSAQSVRDSIVWLEACENYQKQSWRNRCRILSANGPLDLNVPVVHENGTFSLPIKRIRVDYSTPWVLRTERAIESAYCSSPFFIYYRDPLFAILDSHPETLWELDRRLIDFFCAKIGIAPDIRETESFVAGIGTAGLSPATSEQCRSIPSADTGSCSEEGSGRPVEMTAVRRNDCLTAAELNCHSEDYRAAIHPKRPNTIMRDLGLENPYWQVFRDKFGFVPGLSIMDLLFNEGPESICWLLPTYDRFPRKA